MFKIRRIFGAVLPGELAVVSRVQEIFRHNFADVADYADKIPQLLNDPFRHGYRTLLLVSEGSGERVTGFSLFLHFPEINSSLLDFLAVDRSIRGGGIGGVLYQATREYCRGLGSRGLYMEVLPDDSRLDPNPQRLAENKKRLRFYERYGVRPIIGTEFETPVGEDPAPYLLFDGLGRAEPLKRSEARAAVRLILKRKYSHIVGPDYIERVVESFTDDPVKIRQPRYIKTESPAPVQPKYITPPFIMVVCDQHENHNVQEHGYVERPARVGALREAISKKGLFSEVAPRHFGEEHIREVHDGDFVTYLKNVCEKLSPNKPVYPYVFPIRRPERRPKDLALRAGYYCIDTFTPLDRNAYQAARNAVDVALTAAEEVLKGCPVAYALCRPPGHHAQRRVFGGFCYFCNGAIAAHRLSKEGKVAILDIDFHHGNGPQDIFYNRKDVLTVSLHGHPNFAYPYFSGFSDETGEGDGKGFNRNFPLGDGTDEPAYLSVLDEAIKVIRRFQPKVLIVSLGLDTMKGDPTGGFTLSVGSLGKIGQKIGELELPTLVIQEGGYNLTNLRRGSASFFGGLASKLQKRMFPKSVPVKVFSISGANSAENKSNKNKNQL